MCLKAIKNASPKKSKGDAFFCFLFAKHEAEGEVAERKVVLKQIVVYSVVVFVAILVIVVATNLVGVEQTEIIVHKPVGSLNVGSHAARQIAGYRKFVAQSE